MYLHKKKTKNIAARSNDRKEKIQMTRVKSIPDRMTAWRGSSVARALSLSKKSAREDSKLAWLI
jgi:hypothetical protein